MNVGEVTQDQRSSFGLVASAGGLGGVFGGYFLQTFDTFFAPIETARRCVGEPMAYVPISAQMAVLFVLLSMLFAALIASQLVRGAP